MVGIYHLWLVCILYGLYVSSMVGMYPLWWVCILYGGYVSSITYRYPLWLVYILYGWYITSMVGIYPLWLVCILYSGYVSSITCRYPLWWVYMNLWMFLGWISEQGSSFQLLKQNKGLQSFLTSLVKFKTRLYTQNSHSLCILFDYTPQVHGGLTPQKNYVKSVLLFL